jgi:hypothetical protein
VRTFLRRYRSCTIVVATDAHALKIDDKQATDFLCQLASLHLIRPAECLPLDKEAYEITTHGNALANASAAGFDRALTARQNKARLGGLYGAHPAHWQSDFLPWKCGIAIRSSRRAEIGQPDRILSVCLHRKKSLECVLSAYTISKTL